MNSIINTIINPSPKLIHNALELKEYDYTVGYLKKKNNFVADALSKIPKKDLQNIRSQINKIR